MWEGFKAGFMLLLMDLWEAMKKMGLAFQNFFLGLWLLVLALAKSLWALGRGTVMGLWGKLMGLFGK